MSHNPYQSPSSPVVDAPASRPLQTAGKGRRFLTYVVDYICFMIASFFFGAIIGIVLGPDGVERSFTAGWQLVFSFALLTGYYLFFEGAFGRTPGKFACGTMVVDESGAPPRFGQILGRTFARFIPFEPFSLLFANDADVKGWHDSLPKTRVVLVAGR